jgi:hypothetical protein
MATEGIYRDLSEESTEAKKDLRSTPFSDRSTKPDRSQRAAGAQCQGAVEQ